MTGFTRRDEWYCRANFVKELSDEVITLHAKFGRKIPTLHSTMHLYPIEGAVHRVGPNETAFGYRNPKLDPGRAGIDPVLTEQPIIGWTKAYWQALHPHSAGRAYGEFLDG